jgi:arylsulfatase
MERMDPESHEYGYIGRKFFAYKMWVPTAGGPYIASLVKSLQDYPPRQGADSLSAKKVLDEAMKKLEQNPGR